MKIVPNYKSIKILKRRFEKKKYRTIESSWRSCLCLKNVNEWRLRVIHKM